MKLIKAKAAKFDNTKIYVHRRCQKEGRAVDGRYLRVGGIFRLGTPDIARQQFIGVGKELFLTMKYPEWTNDLLGIASDLYDAKIDKHPLVWFGQTSVHVQKGSLWYFIPKGIWGFKEGDYDKVIHTTSYVSIITGESGNHYYLLHVPLISRNFLRSRYRKFSLKQDSQRKDK